MAVIVEEPADKMLRIFPSTVATFGLEEVKDHGPGEFVVGGVTAIFPTPIAVVIGGKGPKIVVVALAFGVSASPNNATLNATLIVVTNPRGALFLAPCHSNFLTLLIVFTRQLSPLQVANTCFNAQASISIAKIVGTL